MNKVLLSALVAVLALFSTGGTPPQRTPPAFLNDGIDWADSVMATLSSRQRIAQLMMVAAYSNKDTKHITEVDALVRDHGVGGLIFFQGGPVRQANLTNRFQDVSNVPLLIGMDLEWGLAMRLDSTMRFPKQMTLGAMRNDSLIETMGREIARQMQRLGVHVSFSPVADVNNNPANPVINDRSFGEDRDNVTRKCIAYMRGLQAGGVIATAKHFPGHGDTDTDSHTALTHHRAYTGPIGFARTLSLPTVDGGGPRGDHGGPLGGARVGHHPRHAQHFEQTRGDGSPGARARLPRIGLHRCAEHEGCRQRRQARRDRTARPAGGQRHAALPAGSRESHRPHPTSGGQWHRAQGDGGSQMLEGAPRQALGRAATEAAHRTVGHRRGPQHATSQATPPLALCRCDHCVARS
ncbi:MAG: hypothetical protein IPK99_11135 [Flavobacteriales bacterium]|nr:hypothetical protein [Flavobacteriales bacterium]